MIKRLLLVLAIAMPASTGIVKMGNASDITVPANRTSSLGVFYVYEKRTCRIFAPPTVTILDQPENGTIAVKEERRQLSPPCDNRTALGPVIYYTPDRGYRGPDSFRYQVRQVRRVDGRGQKTRRQTIEFVVQ